MWILFGILKNELFDLKTINFKVKRHFSLTVHEEQWNTYLLFIVDIRI